MRIWLRDDEIGSVKGKVTDRVPGAPVMELILHHYRCCTKNRNVLITKITSIWRMLEYYPGSTTDKLEEWDNK